MRIFQDAKVNYKEHRRNLYASTGTTRWEDVFGAAQQKVDNKIDSIDSGYFSPKKTEETSKPSDSLKVKTEIHRDPLSAYSGMNSLNLRIKPRQIEYERYKEFNDAEKASVERKEYDAQKITNVFHHSKTYNMFNNDLKESFKELYGEWDGESEDGKGFAYVDKYGFSHVADNFFTALVYSMDGKVYNYEGKQMGGYAVSAKGDRIALLGLDNSVPYGNSMNEDTILSTDSKLTQSFAQADRMISGLVDNRRWNLFDFSKVSRLRSIGRIENK